MSNIQYRLSGGEQVIPLLGDEQTTRSRVVMIAFRRNSFNNNVMTEKLNVIQRIRLTCSQN